MSTRTYQVSVVAAHGGVDTAEPVPARRRGLGAVLVVLGAAVAVLLVAGTALMLVALLARQETVSRASYEGVEALRVDGSCLGDVRVVTDPSMAAGTVEVVWHERWSLWRPSHDAAVHEGTLDMGRACSGLTVGISTVSDVTVRTAPGLA